MKSIIYIQNLKCGGCANTITKQLSVISGVSKLEVQLEESAVIFDYTDESVLEEVKSQLQKLGYPEHTASNSLGTKAKSYISCALGKLS
jgi:copper chaperone CopZ